MRRIYAYIISLFLVGAGFGTLSAQDTIIVPLKIKAGVEVIGPVTYFYDNNNRNAEAFVSVDLDEKKSLYLGAGYMNYKYSQYNYDYLAKGVFAKAGLDFNLLKPDKAQGKYWAGIGIRYGLSRFNSEVPVFQEQNYWGTATSSIPSDNYWGHFLEVSPGVKASIFRNISLGWNINLKKLIHTNTGKDLRPINFPGYGNGTKSVTAGISYFIIWNITYKKIKYVTKPPTPAETEETTESGTQGTGTGTGVRPANQSMQQGGLRP